MIALHRGLRFDPMPQSRAAMQEVGGAQLAAATIGSSLARARRGR